VTKERDKTNRILDTRNREKHLTETTENVWRRFTNKILPSAQHSKSVLPHVGYVGSSRGPSSE